MKKRISKIKIDTIIGRNIRLEREARKITRQELAEYLDISPSHLGLIERGERGLTAVNLSILSEFLEVPIDDFFSGTAKGGKSVRDESDIETQANRKKIQSLITRISNPGLELVINTCKGVIALCTPE